MNKTIFDIGFHKGEDTLFYLLKGYKVLAVDADISLVRLGREKFIDAINREQLILLNYAISDEDNIFVDFHISANTLWNSINKKISERDGLSSTLCQVPSIRLDSLIAKFGLPFYCKIDIEGNDIIALETLKSCKTLPQFLSVETECIGDNDILLNGEEFRTLDCLYELGYRKFKLVDQCTLTVLNNQRFYYNDVNFPRSSKEYYWYKQNKTNKRYAYEQLDLGKEYKNYPFHYFFPNSSGPFGTETAGHWYNYRTAKKILQTHRQDYQSLNGKVWGFWCDWHATV